MHELSVAMSLLDVVAEEAERRHYTGVAAIHIRLGPLSGVVKESLLSAYDLARETTSFTDCRLVVEETPIVIYCPQCHADQQAESIQMLCCQKCGTAAERVVSGNELELSGLEVEK
jgi:hydrogenase nickel incorporation protein HypA/HybF